MLHFAGCKNFTQSNDIEPSKILNDNSNTVIEYKIGQNVAVAYMDAWYPGQIVFVDDNVLTITRRLLKIL
jgi:hypothetical protein